MIDPLLFLYPVKQTQLLKDVLRPRLLILIPLRVDAPIERHSSLRCSTFGEVVTEIADYIDYYNSWRPQAGLGKMEPAKFRAYLLAKLICLPVLNNPFS